MGPVDTEVEGLGEPALGEREFYEAQTLYSQGKLREAERVLRRGLSASPDHPWCHSLLGAILAQQGQLREAEDHLRRAADLSDFTDPGIVRNLALFLLDSRGDPAAAESALRVSLGKRPHAMTFAVLGYVLERTGQAREARAAYLESLRRPLGIATLAEGPVLDEWYAIAMAGFVRTSQALVTPSVSTAQLVAPGARPREHLLVTVFCWVLAAGMLAMVCVARLSEYVRAVLVLGSIWLVSAPPLLPRLLRLSVTREGFSAEMEPRPHLGPEKAYPSSPQPTL